MMAIVAIASTTIGAALGSLVFVPLARSLTPTERAWLRG